MTKSRKFMTLATCSTLFFISSYVFDSQTVSATPKSTNQKGLLGFYYEDYDLKNLKTIRSNQSKISLPEHYNSAHFSGIVRPLHSDYYHFNTSIPSNSQVFINGQKVQDDNVLHSLYLQKNTDYKITIKYNGDSTTKNDALQLLWKRSHLSWEKVSNTVLLSPKYDVKEKEKSSFFHLTNSPIEDSDQDGIPNSWETSGYTVIDSNLRQWQDEFAHEGYTKYLSNPSSAYTARDPYTDLEKVLGNIPISTKVEVRDPLVAAYPAVTVNMKKLHMSKNANVGSGESGTLSTDVSQTLGVSNSIGVGGDIGFSPEGLNAKVSFNYTHSWTNSNTFSSSTSNTWSKNLDMNTVDAAFLNANVQYVNTGSAPIYQVKPTTNFKLQKQDLALATIKAGSNFSANVLNAGGTYPSGNSTIALDKVNDIGSVRINVNSEQLDSLQSNEEQLTLETHQTEGYYAKKKVDGSFDYRAGTWDEVRSNIDNTSAALTLDTGKETLERRISTKDERDNLDKTPTLSIGEAIYKAFDAHQKEDGKWYYQSRQSSDPSYSVPVLLSEESLNIVVDELTSKKLKEQLKSKSSASIFDLNLTRGMKITLVSPQSYYDFEHSSDWTYAYRISGGFRDNKALSTSYRSFSGKSLTLKPHTTYSVRAKVRSNTTTSGKNIKFNTYGTNPNSPSSEKSFSITEKWKDIEIIFNTGHTPNNFKKLMFENTSRKDSLIFDDVAVFEWTNSAYQNNVINWTNKPETNGDPIQNISHLRNITVPLNYRNKDNKELLDLKLLDLYTGLPLNLKKDYLVKVSNNTVIDLKEAPLENGGLTFVLKKKGTAILSILDAKTGTIVRSLSITVGDPENKNVLIDEGRYTLSNLLQSSSDIVMNNDRHIISFKKETTGNHQWEISYNSSKGAYQLKNGRDTSLVLSAVKRGDYYNAEVQSNNDSDNQYWYFYDSGDGYLYFVNKQTGLALDNRKYWHLWDISVKSFERTDNQKMKLHKLKQNLITTITSNHIPQSGQKNRSSNNFGSFTIPSNSMGFKWVIEPYSSTDKPEQIRFNVMQDRSFTDALRMNSVSNNSYMSILLSPGNHMTKSYKNKLYIANPSGATQPFKILIYSISR